MTIKNVQSFPELPERPQDPPEPALDIKYEQILDVLDTLRHERFEIYNGLLKARGRERERLEKACAKNTEAEDEALKQLLMLQFDPWYGEYCGD